MTMIAMPAASYGSDAGDEPLAALAYAERLLSNLLPDENRVRRQAHALTIDTKRPEEFQIRLIGSGPRWIVCFNGWHEEFHDMDSVLALVREALGGGLRLRLERLNQKPWRWTVEMSRSGRWIPRYSTTLVRLTWGAKLTTEYHGFAPRH